LLIDAFSSAWDCAGASVRRRFAWLGTRQIALRTALAFDAADRTITAAQLRSKQ
jgi:hypothetical protein